jgi:tRNA A64-2'-O-ribosylphosphate transferase
LNSILYDSSFAQRVAASHALPLVANERCGSWYIPPALKAGSAYFKSTDGHHGQWDFSLRRLNLQLLDVLGEHGGGVLVDSTRRGKSVPDSLAKTVPIWVAVINRTLFPERGEFLALQCLKGGEGLGESEVAQIESRIGEFAQKFTELGVAVQELRGVLRRPIRLKWATNGAPEPQKAAESGWDMLDGIERIDALKDSKQECNLLVLCSASRRVRGAEVSEGGYIQGAGDDSEGWSHGLTPELFWANKDLLTGSAEDELPEIIRGLVHGTKATDEVETPVLVGRTSGLYLAACAAGEAEEEKAAGHTADQANGAYKDFDLVINCNLKDSTASQKVIDLACKTGKLGSRDLRAKLPIVKSFVSTTLQHNPDHRILITCESGRDLSVGIAVMILCLFYDDSGVCLLGPGVALYLLLTIFRSRGQCPWGTPD